MHCLVNANGDEPRRRAPSGNALLGLVLFDQGRLRLVGLNIRERVERDGIDSKIINEQTTGAAWEMTSLTSEPIFMALLSAAAPCQCSCPAFSTESRPTASIVSATSWYARSG